MPRRSECEIVLRLDPDDSRVTEILSRFEVELVKRFELNGNLVGNHEWRFFIIGDCQEISDFLTDVAAALGIHQQALQLVRIPSAGRRGKRPRIFDVWAVALSNGMFGYVHILDHHADHGDLVRVYSARTKGVAPMEVVIASGEMFPLIFTLVSVGIQSSGWRWIGNTAVTFSCPIFRQSVMSFLRPGVYDDWQLWSKERGWTFEGKLSESHRKLEILVTWAPAAVAERIATGENCLRDIL